MGKLVKWGGGQHSSVLEHFYSTAGGTARRADGVRCMDMYAALDDTCMAPGASHAHLLWAPSQAWRLLQLAALGLGRAGRHPGRLAEAPSRALLQCVHCSRGLIAVVTLGRLPALRWLAIALHRRRSGGVKISKCFLAVRYEVTDFVAASIDAALVAATVTVAGAGCRVRQRGVMAITPTPHQVYRLQVRCSQQALHFGSARVTQAPHRACCLSALKRC